MKIDRINPKVFSFFCELEDHQRIWMKKQCDMLGTGTVRDFWPMMEQLFFEMPTKEILA